MIRKIVSSGRAGVSRGALDAAMALDIPHGGWTFGSDHAEDDPLPNKYHLQEMKTKSISKCVERNVKDADGTLILTFTDDMPDDALSARKCADKHHLPWLQINLGETSTFQAAQAIHEWLKEKEIHILHVVGATRGTPRKKTDKTTCSLLEAVYYLGLIESNMATTTVLPDQTHPPTSLHDIVSRILSDMSLKDRVIVANLKESQLELLQPTLGRYILIQLEHWQKKYAPVFSLNELEKGITDIGDVPPLVLKKLWEELRATHRLRMVK